MLVLLGEYVSPGAVWGHGSGVTVPWLWFCGHDSVITVPAAIWGYGSSVVGLRLWFRGYGSGSRLVCGSVIVGLGLRLRGYGSGVRVLGLWFRHSSVVVVLWLWVWGCGSVVEVLRL